MKRLELRGLGKSFGAARALGDVSLTATAGAVHAVLGENGAGKSTLMKLLSGAEQPDQGEMLLDGAVFRPLSPEAARRAGVSIVYQEPLFCADLTVRENIVLGSEPTSKLLIDSRKSREIARRSLEQVGAAFELDTPLRQLSPADRQLVSIARALSNADCKVLIKRLCENLLPSAQPRQLRRPCLPVATPCPGNRHVDLF